MIRRPKRYLIQRRVYVGESRRGFLTHLTVARYSRWLTVITHSDLVSAQDQLPRLQQLWNTDNSTIKISGGLRRSRYQWRITYGGRVQLKGGGK